MRGRYNHPGKRGEPVPPHPHCLMAQIDPALEQQVLDVPQRQREPHVHHHDETDHPGRGVELAKRAVWFAGAWHATHAKRPILTGGAFALTEPS